MTDDEREFNIRSTPHGDDVAFLPDHRRPYRAGNKGGLRYVQTV